ncbi:GMC oxidoreductase-like protein [Sporothrix schenckii 1099-18]|uniref:Glucose-methanol-choline oxidoreductase N-terminal domain-containing protein n=2 Tax=Sporothrix schenckii TaxID=29908 RepID=U7PVX8_SPOS1|nr:GMC oxidoreductase-like protein [Sporothrix schenckii 1099-18]ERS99813.1 hypothetical protein HMPREF1624_03178 [Sporothrix schenckii ATCC 58251]KJR85803.1 GMC oxidoreductase-like protein [Sporothrix schenckii 1099-18]
MSQSSLTPSLRKVLAFGAGFLSAVAVAYPHNGRPNRWRHLNQARDIASEYDYVIVGGGTAGLTVADRLTEDANTTVLVIEYGALSDSPLISTVQGGFRGMDAQFLYDIQSVPQVNLRNRSTGVMAGKVVGGSSAVNAMMTVRGAAEDYDRWGSFFDGSNASGRGGWSAELLQNYFHKALNFVPPLPDVAKAAGIAYDTAYWGNTSSVYVGWPSFQFPGTTVQFDAFRSMPGVDFPVDSGAGHPGVYWFPSFMDPHKVTRSYARTGHHDRAVVRSNYHLLTRTKVDHIVLETNPDQPLNDAKATGVRFIVNATTATGPVSGRNATVRERPTQFVKARREVILAAGGIHSPQILQLSGIGPKPLLDAANITTIVDLPGVGQNFQDHPMLTASFSLSNYSSVQPSAADLFLNATFRAWSDAEWKANRTGPQSLGVGNAAAWLPFPVISERWADVAANLSSQDHAAYLPPNTHATVAQGYKKQMDAYALALKNNRTAFYNNVLSGGPSSGVLVMLHPLSRGTVNIDPVDPYNREPVVDYRALSNPLDVAIMADMIRYTRRYFMENPALAQYRPVEIAPGDYVSSEEDLATYLSETVSPTEYHPAGTCAMLPQSLGGVVDQYLKVYGVPNLRVIDASIIPTLPGANTCQTVYAVAELAADLIKGHQLW